MSTDVKSVVTDWADALNRHDPDAAAACMSEDCVFVNVGTGERLVGRAAMRDDFANLVTGPWSDVHVETTNLLIADDWYTKEWIITGVHTGDMPGLPATGRPFRLLGAGVGQVRDGHIAHLTEYWNLVSFLQQVGAFPPGA